MSKNEGFAKGDRVYVDELGEGDVTLVGSANTENGPQVVYHVTFENGETRHFTEEHLERA